MEQTKLQTATMDEEKQKEEITSSLLILPYDIIVDDILPRLPVKSILRFSTKQFKILELDSEEFKYGPADNQDFTKKKKPVVTYGLGHNCDTNDYKIVKATAVDGSDSWKPLPNIVPYEIVPYSTHAFVNGALHWLATPCPNSTVRQSMLIVSFDIGGENFREIPLGPLTDELNCSSSSVFVWIMKDHKVSDSWTKLFIAQLPVVATKELCSMTFQWELKNGKVLFKARSNYDSDTYFVVYDPSVHQKPAGVSEVYRISGRQYSIETYVESLVSISGGTYAGEPTDLQKQAVREYLQHKKRTVLSKYLKQMEISNQAEKAA
ncbi:hypothetical protein C5167_017572 [Papaver somniferum]|uniref:F-box associated domain-containing protein n=1 Tax=Papaver somniferum TaxID=3469 RepID=A0A4Y7IKB4_PAPSO|nr:hypothetical protein C5167_017572 [Papaver somniferum]